MTDFFVIKEDILLMNNKKVKSKEPLNKKQVVECSQIFLEKVLQNKLVLSNIDLFKDYLNNKSDKLINDFMKYIKTKEE
jgi:hypothetical protein